MATLETISEGGLGIKGATDLPPGKIVTLEISSEQLYNKIKVEAEVRYISSDGFVGLIFKNFSGGQICYLYNLFGLILRISQQPEKLLKIFSSPDLSTIQNKY